MRNSLKRNGSGYLDLTAALAIQSADRSKYKKAKSQADGITCGGMKEDSRYKKSRLLGKTGAI